MTKSRFAKCFGNVWRSDQVRGSRSAPKFAELRVEILAVLCDGHEKTQALADSVLLQYPRLLYDLLRSCPYPKIFRQIDPADYA